VHTFLPLACNPTTFSPSPSILATCIPATVDSFAWWCYRK
jgi:hypothetical protein